MLTLRAVAIFTNRAREQLFALVSIREIDEGTTSTASASRSCVKFTGEKVDVEEVRKCYYLLLKQKYDFLEIFNRPSNKEIPLQYTLMKNDSNIHHVKETPFDGGKQLAIYYKDGTLKFEEYFNSPEDKKRIMERRKQERLELDEKVKKKEQKDRIKGIIITSLLLTPVLLLFFAARYYALALTVIAYCIYGLLLYASVLG